MTFWSDPFIEGLNVEQKLFYLYLITNDRTTSCGIYEITVNKISNELGMKIDKVKSLINDLQKAGKIKYSTKTNEVAIKNWAKYNQNPSPKVQKRVSEDFKLVKDTVLIQYLYSMDTQSQQEQEEEPEQEEEKEQTKVRKNLYLFSETKYFSDKDLFISDMESYAGGKYSMFDLEHYYHALLNSGSKGYKYKDWIAACANWIIRDEEKGQARMRVVKKKHKMFGE